MHRGRDHLPLALAREQAVLLLRCHGRRHARAGLAYLPEDDVQLYLADGRLVRVLSDWCPS
jgi:DNA-binding transcriptional LysR family regulator